MKKRTAQATLRSMPDEFHVDELLERLVLIEQVEKGLDEPCLSGRQAGQGHPA